MNKWDTRYMELTEHIATWSSCCKVGVGCIITVNNRIIATGYNGAPSGVKSCKEYGFCLKKSLGYEHGPLMCRAVHAEQNALMQAAQLGASVKGGTLYCTHFPCNICSKMIINSGIKKVIYKESYPDDFSASLLSESCVEVERYK